MAQAERKLEGLIDAVADGLRTEGLRERLEALEAERARLRREVATLSSQQDTPALHPDLAVLHRAQVERLRDAHAKNAWPEVREALRALVERVNVHPPAAGGLRMWN